MRTITRPEVRTEANAPTDSMGKIERYGRIIGGYALGFLGVGTTVSGLASGNFVGVVAGSGIGLGMIYGADRLLRPIHSEQYGLIPQGETTGRKVGRFATFAASMGVHWIGYGLISNAILPNAWTGANFNFGERALSGGLGVLGVLGGGAIERVSRRSGFTNNEIAASTTENITVEPRHRLREWFGSDDRAPDEDITTDLAVRLATSVRESRDRARTMATSTYDRWTERFPEPRRSELRRNFAQEIA